MPKLNFYDFPEEKLENIFKDTKHIYYTCFNCNGVSTNVRMIDATNMLYLKCLECDLDYCISYKIKQKSLGTFLDISK